MEAEWKPIDNPEVHWQGFAQSKLLKKRVKQVSYMPADMARQMGYHCRPLVIVFDDGTYIFAQSDDEGNDGGAYAGGSLRTDHDHWTIPVLYTD